VSINRISLTPYREVLATPGVKMLLLGGFLARVPYAAMGLSLTLYIRFGLDLGYFEAGIAGALFVIGSAIGSTMHGRLADRYGIRLVLALATVAMGSFWLTVATMSYPVLLLVALPAGALNLPVFVVVRQPLAALISERNRRTAYALDSTLVEVTFMIGPAAATSMAAMVAPTIIPIAIGIWAPLAGAFLWWLNPRTRAPGEESADRVRPNLRSWMTGPMLAMFLVGVGATVALGGTDMAVISLLEYSGQLQYAWIVLAAWAFYSMVGGFLLGASRRELSPVWLVAVLGITTVPLGLTGQWWLLALALIPAGVVCAPTIATSVDKVSRLAPAAARGEAMGMHGSAVTLGIALGGPFTGWVVDNIGVQWGFAAAGAGAMLAAVAAGMLTRSSGEHRREVPAPV